jgi:ubiquinone/menaquinone biosynthesis C-methylase UbiE
MHKNPFSISVLRFDEFAQEYASKFMNIEAYEHMIETFCKEISSSNPKILELGCGPGNITKYLKTKFPNSSYVAIDLSPKMIEIARQHVKDIDFRIMDVREMATIDTTFDAIMCSFCLPFLSKEDTDNLIVDCAKQLNTNGIIYISTMEGDETDAGFESTSFSGSAEIYFNYHLRQNLEKSLLENGFDMLSFCAQDYHEPDGSILTDLIFIGIKR